MWALQESGHHSTGELIASWVTDGTFIIMVGEESVHSSLLARRVHDL